MDDNLWYERYRPKSLDDIIISKAKKIAVKEWFEKYQAGDTAQCAMLFIGPPGLGKTSLAHIILKEYGYTVKEFNASDIRSKSLITENLDGLINMTSVKSLGVIKNKPAIIMDEVDGMFKGDRGGVDALLSFISIPSKRKRKNFVNHNRSVPVICICNVGNVKKETINNLKKECFTIEFTLPSSGEIMTVLDKVACHEDMDISDEAKDQIIEYAQTDFRRLICLLEFIDNIYGKVCIGMDQMKKCFSIMCLKEQDLYVTDAVKKMINEKLDPYRIQAIYNSDKSKTPMVIHQNYLRAIAGQGKQKVEEKLADSISIMESLIVSDEVEKIMYNTQNWGLQPVQSLTCAHIPSHYINRKAKQHIIETKWAGILSVNSQAQNLWKNVHQELNQMCSNKTYSVTDLQHLIEVIFHYLITAQIEPAMMRISNYDLCPEFHDHDKKSGKDRKKALTIIDKLGKYIKISPYYVKWDKFLQKNKNNKDLDAKIYDAYIKHERRLQSKMTDELRIRMMGAPRKFSRPSTSTSNKDKRINVKVSPKIPIPVLIPNPAVPKTAKQQKEQVKKRKVTVVLKK